MNEGFLVAAGLTLAGSVHCAGMCGAFVLSTAAGARSSRALAVDQVLLHLGKAATYAFLGALAGAFGGRILASRLLGVGGKVLAVAAGLAIVVAGLTLLGLGGAGIRPGRSAPRGPRSTGPGDEGAAVSWSEAVWRRLVGPLMTSRPAGFPLVVGMAMGLLPCPLVYAGLAGAAASGSAAGGAAILAGVALGSLPALALVAAFGTALRPGARLALARGAGVLLVTAGLLTAGRGLGLHVVRHDAPAGASHCGP